MVQGKHVEGNQEGSADVKKMRTWRQYMNRCVSLSEKDDPLLTQDRLSPSVGVEDSIGQYFDTPITPPTANPR